MATQMEVIDNKYKLLQITTDH